MKIMFRGNGIVFLQLTYKIDGHQMSQSRLPYFESIFNFYVVDSTRTNRIYFNWILFLIVLWASTDGFLCPRGKKRVRLTFNEYQ
jgi:hypothetical protein